MAGFLNHVTISAPRNSTFAHTVSPSSGTVVAGTSFTPTVGRFLLCICEGGVTSYGPSTGTPPAGWIEASSVIGNTGLYAWVKTATGSDSVVLTHNGSNYPIVCDFYEFPAGTTFFTESHGTVSKTSTNVSITGLTGTNFCIAAKDQGVAVFDGFPYSAVWDGASVESIDINIAGDVTDGCFLTVGYSENWSSATYAPTATVTSNNGTTCEVVSVVLNLPSPPAFLNHATIAAPRNGTFSHTVDPSSGSSGTLVAGTLFTPTAGRFLLCVVDGPVTTFGASAGVPPAGWILSSGASIVANTGLYAFYKTAAGSDTMVANHNGSNYPVVFDFYEFPAGTTWVTAAALSLVQPSDANPAISGLTGTNVVMAAKARTYSPSTTTTSGAWNQGTETVDSYVSYSTTEGYWLSVAYLTGYTSASFQPTCVVTLVDGITSHEALTWALNVPAGITYNKILDQRVVAAGATQGSGDYTSSSFTTQAGTVLVAIIGVGINGNSSTMDYDLPRPVTSGLTWIPRCRRFTTGSFSTVSEIWVADNASAGSKTIAQSGAGTWDTSIRTIDVVVLELTGAAAADLQGNPFVIGGRIYGAGVDPGAQSISLPVAPEAGSLVVAAVTSSVYSTTSFSVTPGADMTEVADHANGSNDTNNILFQAQVRAGSTSQTVAWQDIQAGGSGADSYAWALVAAEFKAAGLTPMSQAVRFNGSTSFYKRAAFGFPAATDFSLTFWLKLATDRNTYSNAVAFGDAGSNYAHFGYGSTGDLLGRDLTTGGANTGYSTPIGRWVFFANTITVAGAGGYMLWTENELASVNGYGGSAPWNFVTTALDFFIGNDSYNDYFDGSVAAVKIWSAALTQAELQAEQFSSNPVRTSNLFAYYPFNAGPSFVDSGPSAKTLTQFGTPTLDTYGPPIIYVSPTGANYNETGRSITVAATVTCTDRYRTTTGLYTDNFNRADTTTIISGGDGLNGVALDWSGDGWQISSNKALRTGAGSDYVTFASTLGMPDHYVEADYDQNGGAYCVVNIRRPSATNVETGYLGYVDPGGAACHIAKIVAGSFSSVPGGDFSGSFPTTGRIRLEVVGTLLTLKINGATIGSTNDATITTGNYAGMNGSSLALMDNFAIGGISTPVVTTLYTPLVQFPLLPMGG